MKPAGGEQKEFERGLRGKVLDILYRVCAESTVIYR